MPQSAGTGIGDVNFVVTRVEVTGGSRSINCAANCTVQDSYLHGQYTDQRGIDHESAIRMGSNSVIRHNHITCDATPVPPDAGCSAALTGYGDFAIVQKNTIDNNLIDGGPYGSMGYCAYGGSTTGKPYSAGVNNIKFTNNIFHARPERQVRHLGTDHLLRLQTPRATCGRTTSGTTERPSPPRTDPAQIESTLLEWWRPCPHHSSRVSSL